MEDGSSAAPVLGLQPLKVHRLVASDVGEASGKANLSATGSARIRTHISKDRQNYNG